MKRILALVLVVAMISTVCCVNAFADSTVKGLSTIPEEYTEYVAEAIEKSEFTEEQIDTDNIFIVENTSPINLKKNLEPIMFWVALPISGLSDISYAGFEKGEYAKAFTNFVSLDGMIPPYEGELDKYIEDNSLSEPTEIKNMWILERVHLFAYNVKCDNVEYIIPQRFADFSLFNVTEDEACVLEIGKAYTVDEFVSVCEKEAELYNAYKAEEREKDNRPVVYVDKDGEEVAKGNNTTIDDEKNDKPQKETYSEESNEKTSTDMVSEDISDFENAHLPIRDLSGDTPEIPFEMMDLTNSTYLEYMNGASSEKGTRISNRYFKTTTNSCYLNVCEVDTNGVQGTVTFTVKNKETGEIIKDANGVQMVYSFTSDSKGSLASAVVKTLVFSTPTPFYFEISTSNPIFTTCYGHYLVTEGPLTAKAYLEGKVKNLIELGIVEGDPDGNLRLDENITRAEFTKVICKALNAAPAPTSVAPYFSDVDANFWAFGYIETARQYGLINGYGDDQYHPTFKPYNNITYSESFKMIVEMLGYGLFAEDLGGFPDGYKTVALQDLELFRASVPDYSAPITRGELFEIVYNALDVPIVEVYNRTNREFMIMNGVYDDTPLKTLRMALENRQQKLEG